MTAPGPFYSTVGGLPGVTGFACNCMYGNRDPRCCIAKAREAEIEARVAERTAALKAAFEKVLKQHKEALEQLADM